MSYRVHVGLQSSDDAENNTAVDFAASKKIWVTQLTEFAAIGK